MSRKLNYFSAIKFLSKYIKNFTKHFVMFYFGWLVDSVLTMVMPILFGIMIDEIVYYQNIGLFIKIALVFLVCILFSGALYFLLYAQHGYLMNMFVFSIRKELFEHLQECDAGYMANATTGEIIAVVQDYPEQCMHFIIRNIIHTVNGILLLVLYTVYLIIIDWRIGLIAFVTSVVSVFLSTRFKGKIRSLGDEERNYYGKHVSWLYEVFNAMRDIRILGAEQKVEETFETNQNQLFKVGIKNNIITLSAENVQSFFNLVVQLIIYGIAAYLAFQGNLTLGTLTVILSFYSKLSSQISIVSSRYLDAQNRVSYIQKIYDFLQVPMEQGGPNDLYITNGEITYNNVTFGYEDKDSVLKNITLKINPGERVALVGKSGCGKTTLVHLLVGFYQTKNGEICVDGQNLAECNLKSIRQSIGLIQQDVLVFDGTIRQNLLMGNLHATEKQLLEACEAAGLSEFVVTLPKGIDTIIGKDGIGLSGGQKQRIAIARIYLKNPKIVIFDEATSALDKETEEAIHHTWKTVLKDKTSIVIAHRESSVMLCERAIILENGMIVESGNPVEMRTNSETYRTLFAIKEEG